MRYLQNPSSFTDRDEYLLMMVMTFRLVVVQKETFLITAITLINRLFREDHGNEAKSQDKNSQVMLANNNQRGDGPF